MTPQINNNIFLCSMTTCQYLMKLTVFSPFTNMPSAEVNSNVLQNLSYSQQTHSKETSRIFDILNLSNFQIT